MRNGSIITEFFFTGFPIPQWLRAPVYFFFIFLYVFILLGNTTIIIIVKKEQSLHLPMYFFIANFSFLEVWYTTVTVPKLIQDLMYDNMSIAFSSCIVQFYFFMVCGANEHCLLSILAYDRFIAICQPLYYSIIMKPKTCVQLILGAWLLSFLAPASTAFSLYNTLYCDVHIDHFLCDIAPLLQISCSDSTAVGNIFYTLATVLLLSSLCFICMSYFFIIFTILHLKSPHGRQNAFSTCASHLTVVIVFYSSLIFMYVRPKSHKFFPVDKLVSMVYVFVSPALNPIIYSFRNKAMKKALRKYTTNCTIFASMHPPWGCY